LASHFTLLKLRESRSLLLAAQASPRLLNLLDAEFDNQVEAYKDHLTAKVRLCAGCMTEFSKQFTEGTIGLDEFSTKVNTIRCGDLLNVIDELNNLHAFLQRTK
jgi:hypothetical protein